MPHIHFIAIGGKVMHALAIALHQQGYHITGSDDALYGPTAQRLAQHQLLPPQAGWFPDKITPQLDAVILGMHAKDDNPERQKAQVLGIPIYSFPEYLLSQCQNKERVVIAGSHGKTTITAMIMHVLQTLGQDFDYMVGGEVPGFDLPLRLTPDAPVMILEGDEYPASRLDTRPKFLHYQHHIALISGIAWDHLNVYPTFERYRDAFAALIAQTPKAGAVFWNKTDPHLKTLVKDKLKDRKDVFECAFETAKGKIEAGGYTSLKVGKKNIPLRVFGKHNLENISAAQVVCERLGVKPDDFYAAIASFKGVGWRLQVLDRKDDQSWLVFRDYAHAPSKWRAATDAVKEQYPKHHLTAILELHTYSSLDSRFFAQFRHTLATADAVVIFCDAQNLVIKGRPLPTQEALKEAFFHPDLQLFTDAGALHNWCRGLRLRPRQVLLWMSSGNFGGFDLEGFFKTKRDSGSRSEG
ncbi:MAG: UDP-N-acetylmuramate--L-alanine ligase [Bernardetiaceae bacterium]